MVQNSKNRTDSVATSILGNESSGKPRDKKPSETVARLKSKPAKTASGRVVVEELNEACLFILLFVGSLGINQQRRYQNKMNVQLPPNRKHCEKKNDVFVICIVFGR